MTTTDIPTHQGSEPHHAAESPAATPSPLGGDPTLIGVPTFLAGSIALGLTLVGYVPPAAAGAPIAIILAATSVGQLIAAVWAAALGQNAVASVFGIFGGFWLSYAILVLGLTHNWFGLDASAATGVQAEFLISWLAVIVLLTLGTLRLPAGFTILFVIVDLALALVLAATLTGSAGLRSAGGFAVFGFVLVGCYLFLNVTSLATGGRGLPLGRPVLRG